MRRLWKKGFTRGLLSGDLLLVLLSLFVVACSPWDSSPASICFDSASSSVTGSGNYGAKTLLPGEQTWKNGVSSFLFGTNDTQEWAGDNVETNPAIQQALKAAHFTLMRTFFFDKSLADGHATTDAEIEQRIQTVENSGMICLGVFPDFLDTAFTIHVVRYLGSRCNLYEFGNEPDYNGYTVQQYLQQWNKVIPQLRQINPQAKFIGPVISNDTGNQCDDLVADVPDCFLQQFLSGVKSSGVLPDAVSFHWYPCYGVTETSCLAKASSYAQVTNEVRCVVHATLGKNLPVGITEWNYDASVPPPDYGTTFIQQFTTQALMSMIQAGLDFANQFDAQSYGGYGGFDMFDLNHHDQPKPQYYAIKNVISQYFP